MYKPRRCPEDNRINPRAIGRHFATERSLYNATIHIEKWHSWIVNEFILSAFGDKRLIHSVSPEPDITVESNIWVFLSPITRIEHVASL